MKNPARPRQLAALLAATLLPLTSVAQTTTPRNVFSDDFTSASRDGWYSSNNPATTVNYTPGTAGDPGSPGALTLVGGGATAMHLLHYLDPKTTLAVGDEIKVRFTYTLSAASTATQLRFGLFDSNDSAKVTGDGHNTDGTATSSGGVATGFNNYTGYRAIINMAQGTSSRLDFADRAATSSPQHLLTSNAAYTGTLGTIDTTDSTNSLLLGAGQTFSVTFTLTRATASTLNLFLSVSGVDKDSNSFAYSITATDSTAIVTAFDTFAFSLNNSSGVNLGMTGITITHTSSPIPEPATVALSLGLAAALLFVARRHLRK
ncbi:MAG: hypothetical protein LBK99_00860 [Opitutaceae bacterium]|jgi:hypothetical protein|nr:hypothetical protein [Opitutaceae bacterium]